MSKKAKELAGKYEEFVKASEHPEKKIAKLKLNPKTPSEDTEVKTREQLARHWLNGAHTYFSANPNLTVSAMKDLPVSVFTEKNTLTGHNRPIDIATTYTGKQVLISLRGRPELIDTNRFRSPCFEPDICAHEYMHLRTFLSSKKTMLSGVNKPVEVLGVEEAFCDLFALSYLDIVKQNIGTVDDSFNMKLGPVHASTWSDVNEVAKSCEVEGVAKRDYSNWFNAPIDSNHDWQMDEHYHGRKLTKGLFEFCRLASFKGQERQVEAVMWDYWFSREERISVSDTIYDIMEYLGTEYDSQKGVFSCLKTTADGKDRAKADLLRDYEHVWKNGSIPRYSKLSLKTLATVRSLALQQ